MVSLRARTDGKTLDRLRIAGDPPADRVAEDAEARGLWPEVNRALAALDGGDGAAARGLPEPLRAYLDETSRMPRWADRRALARSQEVFALHGPWIILALHCASLPYCYGAAKGVKALYLTDKLRSKPWRRLLNTAQFLVDVMAKGAFAPDRHGVRSAQKVRLVHAALRVRLGRDPRWAAAWGLPINQEDLAGTMLSFSSVVLDALEKLDIALPAGDREAYIHAWNVVGWLLGLEQTLLPESDFEAARLKAAIEARQVAPCAEGQAMTRSLLVYLDQILNPPGITGVPAALVRHFLGDRIGDVLGVDAPGRSALALAPIVRGVSLVSRAIGQSRWLSRTPETFGRKLLERLMRGEHGGERAPFRVPEALHLRWGIASR
jgi:hypothetical protein